MTLTALNTAAAAHHFPIRVYYEDTDAGGIVYYANYLKFAERARTEMLREAGFHHTAMMQGDGLMLAVRRVNAEYLRPAKLDDALEVATSVIGLGAATIELDQSIRRGGQELCRVVVTIACVGRDGRPARLPAPLRAALSAHLPS
ncbi:tol-pal system-associated acyl-CoA thioesterase [Dongia rigui]|uniref:Tol-pal system-associated acyl-CoA thioesterase n=1 Tax=Dongia rigui TaxID=940149 RepID=A0ABU5E1S4_9PROT|nr:tol-pal system-associated acyl-CoA thioesterase [Dongia rigui]MDY0873262.1 tol-pal system-associated acyl-CoA thioesterase [Dongia rigui]